MLLYIKNRRCLYRKNIYYKGIREIAFCCISTGEFRFPKDEACRIAIKTVRNYLKKHTDYFDKIVFNVFTDEDYNIYLKNLGEEYGRI